MIERDNELRIQRCRRCHKFHSFDHFPKSKGRSDIQRICVFCHRAAKRQYAQERYARSWRKAKQGMVQ
jgi:hypothetical protein